MQICSRLYSSSIPSTKPSSLHTNYFQFAASSTKCFTILAQKFDAPGSSQKRYRVKYVPKGGLYVKATKLVERIQNSSEFKDDFYGALDSFVAFDVEFPLPAVKKALRMLYDVKDWKRIIQVTKWMLSKGQGKTLRNYYILLNALIEEQRIEEVEELWRRILSKNLENTPRVLFTRVISMYERANNLEKMLEVFADMDELQVKPDYATVLKISEVFKKLGEQNKYEKMLQKYPKPKWEYRYIKGKRVKRRLSLPDIGKDQVEG